MSNVIDMNQWKNQRGINEDPSLEEIIYMKVFKFEEDIGLDFRQMMNPEYLESSGAKLMFEEILYDIFE